jgi:precorrin-6B methylase 1
MSTHLQSNKAVDAKKLAKALEPMIRKIVREELARVAAKKPNIFYLESGSPLYSDMQVLLREKQAGKVEMLSRTEALGD